MDKLNRYDIDHLCYLIAKEYKKQNRMNPECEIIIVGGASVLLNYNFREETTDIDSLIKASSNIKDIINKVGDENGLPVNWLNDDFKQTDSFSNNLVLHSKFYKTFCGCLNVRTITAEYLLAMKLRSLRDYKYDKSDIIGIMKEEKEKGTPSLFDKVARAYIELYGRELSADAKDLLLSMDKADDLEELFYETRDKERATKERLTEFEEKYPNVLTKENVKEISENLSKAKPLSLSKKGEDR